ncbi:MAG: hypothetical protein O9345_19065 [Burkholderiaceae bacterium]|jgi:hypothetical protein|nr:hypothetical protein [Burkholderiales bacterium]MCZ8108951.1 hypothetical protein [Burkholderiales bacterium]MCZ8340221.1 hypothetical protein [Burkholderiaceae bacterium]
MNVLPSSAARVRAAAVLAALALASGASAHDGHDHADPKPAAGESSGGPRFAAAAGPFELVGALEGRRLVLWLDRADDNAPIAGASIELDVGGRSHAARAEGDVYVVELDAAPAPGVVAIAATIVAGEDADLLAAELRIEAPPPAADAARAAGGWVLPSDALRLAGVAAVAALVAGLVGWRAGRRRAGARA